MWVAVVYASTVDLEAKWQSTLTSSQQAAAAVLLEEGSAMLRAAVYGLDAAIAAGTVQGVLVRKVLTDAVLRVLRNPSGVTTQVVGPESATWSGQAQRAELEFLPREIGLITPSTGLIGDGYALGTIPIGFPDYCSPAGRTFDSERRSGWC